MQIKVYQRSYTNSIINSFSLNVAKIVSVPTDKNMILYSADGNDKQCKINVPYQEAIKSLLFLALLSRSDIAFAINATNRHMSNFSNPLE